MRWKHFAVIVVALMLGACNFPQRCPDAGGIPAKETCYYYLTIASINPDTKEVRSTVAESVVEENKSHWHNFVEAKHYHSFIFVHEVDEQDIQKLRQGGTYMFTNAPDNHKLKLCTTEACAKAEREFKEYEPKK